MSSQRQNRQKNPLYVVTNQGQDVETAAGALDALLKKTGLAPFVDPLLKLLQDWLKEMFSMVYSYAWLVAINDFLTHWLRQMELLLARMGLGPVVPHPDNG